MKNDDVIAQLRAVDPVAKTDLSRIDPGALSALREGITMTTTPKKTRTRRLTRRTAIIGGLSIALVGGGTAYAAHLQQVSGIGDVDGWNCRPVWGEDMDADSIGGPSLTGDPIADCAVYTARAGVAPIGDPVAFTYQGMNFVTPAGQVPQGAVLHPASPADAAAREFTASMRDLVDGAQAECRDQAGETTFAQSELSRLGLTGWAVASDGMTGDEPCADGWVYPAEKRVDILPGRTRQPQSAEVVGIRDTLRAGISDACVSITDARTVADAALATLDYEPWPTTTVIDESVPCARVDMEVGGNVQVTVYGPTVAHP